MSKGGFSSVKRLVDIPSFVAMDMMRQANALAAAGRRVIHLETGQPSTAAPSPVRAAAAAALQDDLLGYTEALGLPSLRSRIAAYYKDHHGIAVDPAHIVLTTGASAGLTLAYLALTGPGGRIGMGRPSYPCYRNIALALGLEPVEIETSPETDFAVTPEMLDGLDQPLDALLIASPANPTGAILRTSQLDALAAWCRSAGTALISDEIYHGIVYSGPAATALQAAPDAIILNGFSKYYSMTGWRLGWMVVPEPRLRRIECLAQNLYIAPPTLSQRAALAAFDSTPETEANVARYAANRALLLDALPRLGFTIPVTPEGAFYIYATIPKSESDSTRFARRMLEETGVAVTPGVDFDRVDGQRYVRIGYAGATDEIKEAIGLLSAWLGGSGRATAAA